jgi:hypothetical protein
MPVHAFPLYRRKLVYKLADSEDVTYSSAKRASAQGYRLFSTLENDMPEKDNKGRANSFKLVYSTNME